MADDAISRRFFGVAAAGIAALGATGTAAKPAAPRAIPTGKPFILTTWDFGPGANAVGWPMLASGASAIDVVEAAINHVELLGDYWVGAGGVPNEVGETTLDAAGNLCVGCSTNGREFKIPGRVGDSPIAGAGAYVDQAVGAAVATGNGDVMMRFLPTYHAVELMRGGMAPQAAAEAAIKRIEDAGYSIGGGIAVIRRDGAHGGAKTGWEDTPFSYSVQTAAGNVKTPVS